MTSSAKTELPKIGVVVGSIREGRRAEQVGAWVAEAAGARGDVEVEVLDLKEFDVPLLTSAVNPSAANKQYESENVRRWSAAVDACAGFVFVTPEYNHGVPGAFKNAVDSLASEWVAKPVAFVSYGSDGGVRAVEQWRQIVANFQMVDVRNAVAMSMFTEWDGPTFTPLERRTQDLAMALDQLVLAVRRAALTLPPA